MKYFIAGLLAGLLATACGNGSKMFKRPERASNKKDFVPCKKEWISEGQAHIGKLCNRYCKERGKKKSGHLVPSCKVWKTTVRVFSNETDFNFFDNGGYKCSNRKSL